jgi:hypothetical protein
VVVKKQGKISLESLFGCVFVPLVGNFGWQA